MVLLWFSVEDIVALTASMFSSQSLYDSGNANDSDIFSTTASMFLSGDDQPAKVTLTPYFVFTFTHIYG